MATGMSHTDLLEAIRTQLRTISDCYVPDNIGDAIPSDRKGLAVEIVDLTATPVEGPAARVASFIAVERVVTLRWWRTAAGDTSEADALTLQRLADRPYDLGSQPQDVAGSREPQHPPRGRLLHRGDPDRVHPGAAQHHLTGGRHGRADRDR